MKWKFLTTINAPLLLIVNEKLHIENKQWKETSWLVNDDGSHASQPITVTDRCNLHTHKSLLNTISPPSPLLTLTLSTQDHKLQFSNESSCIQVSSNQIQYHHGTRWEISSRTFHFFSICVHLPLFQSETFLPYGLHQPNGLWSFIRILPSLNNRPRQVERRLLKNIHSTTFENTLEKGTIKWKDAFPKNIQQLSKGTAVSKPRMKSHKNLSNNISIEDSATTSVLMVQLRTFTRLKTKTKRWYTGGATKMVLRAK